jgi:adenylate cyclase
MCGSMGAKEPGMASTCAQCGATAPPEAAFCPRCGGRLPVVAPAEAAGADRRQVTVVFADLTGFTALAEALDPEDVRAFQNALFETLAQAIERRGGFVEKFVGDAVMAVFGAPLAHEDDPERALDAALDMLQRVQALGATWQSRLGRPVTLHIGVHTGPVVAGSLGVGAGAAYAVTGDTVNTTSRLLSAAAPGTILVSETTEALTRHRHDFAPADTLALRGKVQALRVHRLLGARAQPATARGLASLGLAAPLVGRDTALAVLLGAWDRMHGGRAQWVDLVGEAGSGKSRLLAEALVRLEADGRLAATTVRRIACASLGEPTYGTAGALFRDAYRVDAADTLAQARIKLREGLAELGVGTDDTDAIADVLDVVLGLPGHHSHDIEPEQLRRQVMLAARALFAGRVQQQPLMVVVEDLHWADAASVDLLHDVVDHLAERPLMIVVTHRPEARPWRARRAETTHIELAPLDTDHTRALVARLLGAPDDDTLERLHALVVARAGGNPLFVEEIVRSLVTRGLLRRQGDSWTCADRGDPIDVPATLVGLLLSRIDGLAGDTRAVLQAAAVLGASFDAPLLARLAGDGPATARAVDALVAADLLRRDPASGERLFFAHALVFEAAYQNLLLARRTALHERAGRALEAALGHAGGEALCRPARLADLEALGHHWSLSPDKRRGGRYLMAAGDWARAVYANDDAIRHYERALRTLSACSDASAADPDALAAQEHLGDVLALCGRRGEAAACFESVQQAIEPLSDASRAARLDRKLGGLHWEAGAREQAGAAFARGLQRLGDAGDPIERAHLFEEMGRLAFRAGDNAAAIAWAGRALDEVGDDATGARAAAVLVQARNTLGVAVARTGRLADAVEHIERSIALAEAHGLLPSACRGYTNLAVLYATLDPQRSITTCLRGLDTAKKVGDLGFQSRLYANLAVAYCALTNRCDAEGIEAAQAAASLDRRLGLLDHLAVPLIVLGQIHQCHGDAAQAFAAYDEALALAEQAGEPQLLFPCYDGLATLYLDAGDMARAETWLSKAQAVCQRAGLEPDALMVLPFLC